MHPSPMKQCNPTSSNLSALNDMSAPPLLELHIIEHTLCLAIRLAACAQPLGTNVGAALSLPLNALPRSLSPSLTRAALTEMPWIDLDSCSRLGTLDLIQFMVNEYTRHRLGRGVRKCRPLQWSSDALKFAASRGHLHVLEWWRKQRQVLISFEWPLIAQAAAKSGRMDVLEWWDANRPPDARLPLLYVYREFGFDLEVLKWWLDRARGQQIDEDDVAMFLGMAVRAGSVDALQWMRDHGYMLDFSVIVREANAHGHIQVLDWVLSTVETRDKMITVCAEYIGKFSSRPLAEKACTSLYLGHWTVNQQLVIDWWISSAPWALFADPLEAKRVAFFCARAGYTPQLFRLLDAQMIKPANDLLIAACESGDLDLVKALHERGCWASLEPRCGCVRSDACPTSSWRMASKSGNVDLLNWLLGIDVVDDLTVPLVSDCVEESTRSLARKCPTDALEAASAAGHVGILDWWLCESGVSLEHTEDAMDNASRFCHIDVLEWWYSASLTHGLELKYSPGALTASVEDNDGESGPQRMQIVRWWLLRGFKFPQGIARYGLSPWPATQDDQHNSVFIMGNAIELDLLLKLGLECGPREPGILNHATSKGHVSVLQFLQSVPTVFNAQDLLSNVSFPSLSQASLSAGASAAVEWWKQVGYFEQFEKVMQAELANYEAVPDDEDDL
ncbi:hypothetical protein BCR44DRAFT_1486609 [Catenaria anguillulae PL171]|uniref:Ankyrin repeat-containing domain protein n=1 Tax=Catenaria anguillulae PL171 TaxID=765915 RepID=A0A1Y2HFK0_9FUNG|nr:hypothetical protein BCR44DRAFT_1486609 [Catenaria anguillulae PL171]